MNGLHKELLHSLAKHFASIPIYCNENGIQGVLFCKIHIEMFIALLLYWNLKRLSLSICPTGEVKKDEVMVKSAK